MPRKNFASKPVSCCRRKDANTWIADHGYILEYCPEHPRAGTHNRGCFYQHRLVMEEYLGREIEKDEIVHHIDGNRQNNSLENLELEYTGEHIRKHGKKRYAHSPINDPQIIQLVIEAAQNPTIYKKEFVELFPYSINVVDRILRRYHVKWISPNEVNLDPKYVLKVLQTHSRTEALEILGCSVQLLWNKYPEEMRMTANRKLKSYHDRTKTGAQQD